MLVLLQQNHPKSEDVRTDSFTKMLYEISVEPFEIATITNVRKLLFAGRVSNPKPQR